MLACRWDERGLAARGRNALDPAPPWLPSFTMPRATARRLRTEARWPTSERTLSAASVGWHR
jgi:hypothetical protein